MQTEEKHSFAVGHLSLGYLLGKATAKLTKTPINLPLIFTLSIIPDADLVFRFIDHRGPTHSIIVELAVFIPIFIVYRSKALPYFVALISHPLIGDYITGYVQLFWPITKQQYGIAIDIRSSTNLTLEIILFIAAIAILWKTKDMNALFKSRKSNLILLIPIATLLLPITTGFPLQIPLPLLIPHAIYVLIFLISIASAFRRSVLNKQKASASSASPH